MDTANQGTTDCSEDRLCQCGSVHRTEVTALVNGISWALMQSTAISYLLLMVGDGNQQLDED